MRCFLLIGQSNMAGRGPLGQVEPIVDERIRVFRDAAWHLAFEPLHDDKPDLVGVGLAMSFAASLLADAGESIGLIPCAVGGTSLERWQPEGDLFARALARARVALTTEGAHLAGICWHQGENDAQSAEEAGSYGERFTAMVVALRTALAEPACPLVCGELGPFVLARADFPHASTVAAQTRAALQALQPAAFVSAHGLCDHGDGLHFDAPSQRRFGERYAQAYRSLVGG
jgi:hypothetical protein